MLQPKRRLQWTMRDARRRDATRESALPFLDVLLSFASKKGLAICHILFRAFVRIVYMCRVLPPGDNQDAVSYSI